MVKDSATKQIRGPFKTSVEMLIKDFKEPGEFLQILTDIMGWFYDLKGDEEGKDRSGDNLYFRALIDLTVQPWLKNDLQKMDEGVEEVFSIGRTKGFQAALESLFIAFAKDVTDSIVSREQMQKYLLAMNSLIKLGYAFQSYEIQAFSLTKN